MTMRNKSQKLSEVRLVCSECGNDTTIWRRRSKLKEKGHVKHLWCARCLERTAHVEVEEG